jgi:hypothetical protein
MSTEEKIKNIIGTNAMSYLPYFLIILVLTLFLFYLGDKLTLNERNCNTLRDLYTSYPKIKSIDYNSDDFDYNLRDFYIKASYNSCCSGGVKNDYVNVCALENVLKNGVRFLDFEIYSKNDMPVIGASSTNEYSYKETYNDLAFKTAMEKVKDIAFSSICPNPEDPVILHFRIKSEKSSICDVMAKDINHTFGQDHLDKLYSYEYRGKNLGEVKIKDLKKKVIIIVDKSESIKFKSTKLYEFVNMCSGSEHLRKYRNNDIEHNVDTEEIMKFNKMNMSIVLPDVNVKTDNYSYIHAKEAGVQIMAMNFQNFDSNLKFYSLFFDGTQSAFILKPKEMRTDTYIPNTPDESPQLPLPDQSYGCPADQNACKLTNDSDSDVIDNIVIPLETEQLWKKKTGGWDRNMKLKNIRKKEPNYMYSRILENDVFSWNKGEDAMIETNQGKKYYVKKCKNFDGIPGVNFYSQNFWANLYNNTSSVHSKGSTNNNNMQRYSKDEVENGNKLQQFGDQYCKNAIYKNKNGEFETCSYSKANVKGNPFGKKGGTAKQKAKDSVEGAFNIVWGPGEDNNNDEDDNDGEYNDKYLFWKVSCKENTDT